MGKIYNKVQYEKYYNSNVDGVMEVIDRRTRELKVKFLNTGYERWAHPANVVAGKVKDLSVIRKPELVILDEVVPTNHSGDCKILDRVGKSCTVQFLNTGYTKKANIDNVRAGKVRDPYAKTYLGIACLGEFRRVVFHKRALQLWSNMLKRCYNPNDTKGYYGKGVSVDDRWLCFANFVEDLPKLDNFDGWILGHKKGSTKYNLDKDLKYPGNKVYSRETCMFVTEYENKSAGASKKS